MEKKPVSGSRIVYLYRILGDAGDAWKISLTSENSRTVSLSSDTTQTKDGAIRTVPTPEVEISTTTLMAADDPGIEKLETAALAGKPVELWEVNLDKPATTTGKFKGRYFQGYITNFEVSSPADGNVEVSTDFGINGAGVAGDCTLTDEQAEEAMYAFKDTKAGA